MSDDKLALDGVLCDFCRAPAVGFARSDDALNHFSWTFCDDHLVEAERAVENKDWWPLIQMAKEADGQD